MAALELVREQHPHHTVAVEGDEEVVLLAGEKRVRVGIAQRLIARFRVAVAELGRTE
jgi:hypothetical protein